MTATPLLPLTTGHYRTRNGRVVEITEKLGLNWYGRFKDISPTGGRTPLRGAWWYPTGVSATRHDGVWDLVERVEDGTKQ